MCRRLTSLFVLLLLTVPVCSLAEDWNVRRPGVKKIQVPFSSLKPAATFRIGKTADWVLIADNAVWVAGTKPYSLVRIDPKTNRVVARVILPGEVCSGLAAGFGSVWVPLCTREPSMVRVGLKSNEITSRLALGPAGPEGGIAVSEGSVWLVSADGKLSRIDPATDKVTQTVDVPPSSWNPIFADGIIWITGNKLNIVTGIDAQAGAVIDSVQVGPGPRFLTAGAGSVWTLNQGDGTVGRVDTATKKLIAIVQTGIPGPGGDMCFGKGIVWATVFGLPLTAIDPRVNQPVRQWVGQGGDSMRCGTDSIWLTDYRRGTLSRIPYPRLPR